MAAAAYSSASVYSQKPKQPAKSGVIGWPMYGRDIAGSHYNPDETALTPSTVSRLKPKWVFETGGDVSSQPAVVDWVVYFGSGGRKGQAADAKTGSKKG